MHYHLQDFKFKTVSNLWSLTFLMSTYLLGVAGYWKRE